MMIFYDEKRRYTREEVGGKAFGLFSLLRMDKKVPDFFVVPTGTDISSPVFYKELTAAAERLGGEAFAVRSSNAAEDAESNSFAGQYDTLLSVKKQDLLSAVERVLLSKYGQRTQAYAKKTGVAVSEMAVIVQKQLNPTRSGVAFSTSPFDGAQAVVESFTGQGEALVGGAVTPQRFYFSKPQTPPQTIEGEVFAAAQALERALGRPVDIEWAYDGELYFLQMRPLTVAPVALGALKGAWQEYVYRDFAFFNQCIQAEAAQKSPQEKLFGFHIPVFEGLLVDGHEFYSTKNDKKTAAVWKALDEGEFFERFIQKIYRLVKRTKARVRVLKTTDFSAMDDGALLQAYRREMKGYLNSYLPLMTRPDEYLESKIYQRLGAAEAKDLLFAATYPVKPTYYAAEKYDFLKTAIAAFRGDGKSLDGYIEKYEWINAPLGRAFTPLMREEVEVRIAELRADEAEEKLAALKKARAKNLAARRRALLSVQDEKTKRLVGLLAAFTHLRTYTTENSDRYFYYIRKTLLAELAKRKGTTLETLAYHSPSEVEEILLGKKTPSVGVRRRGGATFVFSQNGYTVYEGNGLSLLKKLLPAPSGENRLTGSIACAGRVRAVVKIVENAADMDKLKKGEILVAKMTTPELVRAMERAAGIITDEGGITCHAAIIAREYAVPCLVGTGEATRLLKDGMEVDLDCVHGVCRIIEEK